MVYVTIECLDGELRPLGVGVFLKLEDAIKHCEAVAEECGYERLEDEKDEYPAWLTNDGNAGICIETAEEEIP